MSENKKFLLENKQLNNVLYNLIESYISKIGFINNDKLLSKEIENELITLVDGYTYKLADAIVEKLMTYNVNTSYLISNCKSDIYTDKGLLYKKEGIFIYSILGSNENNKYYYINYRKISDILIIENFFFIIK